jgi:aldehyde dehydrogenase (NAD+)
MEVRQGIYVDGGWRRSSGDAMFTVVNPYTEEPYGQATIGTAEDVDVAVRSARAALAGPWSRTTLEDRIDLVGKIGHLLGARSDELARMASSSMGKPYATTRSLGNSLQLIDMYIKMARQVCWEYLRQDEYGDTLIERTPVGVVAAIVPWNTPVRSEIKKLIPALLAGCTLVLKPAPETPFGASILVELCAEAGVPPGVVNLVPGDGSTGDLLVRHPDVRKVAFTGSSATGARIATAVAPRFARLQLELGGKSAAVVLADADIATIAPALSTGIFAGSGQQCTATSRVLVPRARQAEVVDALVAQADAQVVGNPLDLSTTMGPLVAERQRTRVLGYVDIGQSEGAKLVAGGGRPATQPLGWFVEPTVFADVTNSMRIAREEIFGPVVAVLPYEDEDEAIAMANDSDYGLGGAVYSADPHHALAVARQIDSGYVAVNRYGIALSAPFGGVKQSGIGREHGVEGYDSFLEYRSFPLDHALAEELSHTIKPRP